MTEDIVTAADANRYFSRILRSARAGKTITITSHGKPVAQLGPVDAPGAEIGTSAEAGSDPASPEVIPASVRMTGAAEEMEAHWATLSPVLVGRWTRAGLREKAAVRDKSA